MCISIYFIYLNVKNVAVKKQYSGDKLKEHLQLTLACTIKVSGTLFPPHPTSPKKFKKIWRDIGESKNHCQALKSYFLCSSCPVRGDIIILKGIPPIWTQLFEIKKIKTVSSNSWRTTESSFC